MNTNPNLNINTNGKTFKLALLLAQTTPRFILIYAFIYGLITYNLYFIIFSILAFINLIGNSLLKEIFKIIYNLLKTNKLPILGTQNRPPGAYNCGTVPSNKLATSSGMPSGHSQNIWFFFSFMLLYILQQFNYKKNKTTKDKIIIGITILLLLIISIFVSYSRVYNGCHTTQQVIFGGLFGLLFGSLAFILTKYIIMKKFN